MIPLSLETLNILAARAPEPRAVFHPARRSTVDSPGDVLARARAYLSTIPGAVSGYRGHDRTYYAAGRLIRGFGLSVEAAYPLFAEWNQKCDPPWPEPDLRRKLVEQDRVSGARGFLLTADPIPPGVHARKDGSAAAQFKNYCWDEVPDGETQRRVKRGRHGEEMIQELTDYTGGWPRLVGGMLFARNKNGDIIWIKSAHELFAWIDWQYSIGGGKGFDWTTAGEGCLTQLLFLEACRIHCEPWDQVELYPHDPPIPGHYYHHPEIPTDTDGSYLTELVRRFQPHTPEDEDLIRLFFLTLIWGGPPRKRPIYLFEASGDSKNEGRGSGKTTVAIMGSKLVGGSISISPREQLRDIQTRLLSPEALTLRVALIDNLKSLRFSDSDLEGLVTTPVISGKQMYVGEGRRPNTLTWVVTSNKPSLSKDLAQRSVIVRVLTPVYTPAWERDVLAYIEANRWKIIGDCIRELRLPNKLPDDFVYSRWAEWEAEVLSKAANPVLLAAELARRRSSVDDDDETASEVADAIRELIRGRGWNPDTDCVLIPSRILMEIVKKFSGNLSQVSGLRWLYNINVTYFTKHTGDRPYRGGIWRPPECPSNQEPLTWDKIP